MDNNQDKNIDIPLVSSSIHAGFPSPAEDFIDESLNLNKELISHPSATFFIRVEGESMKDAEIHTGDLLIVDKAILPYDGCIAVCYIDGEFTLKRIKIIVNKTTNKRKIILVAANPKYKSIEIEDNNNFIIWGVVTYNIHKVNSQLRLKANSDK